MRSKNRKQALVSKLVEETRVVVKDHAPVEEKVATLFDRAARHARRLERLRRSSHFNSEGSDGSAVIERLAFHERAGRYLLCTAQCLLNRDSHKGSLRQMPRLFATADWGRNLGAPAVFRPPIEPKDIVFPDFLS